MNRACQTSNSLVVATGGSICSSSFNIMALKHERAISGKCNEYISMHVGRDRVGVGVGIGECMEGYLPPTYLPPTPYLL